MREMGETLRETFGRAFQNRRRSMRKGRLDIFETENRIVTVYLPPGYDDPPDGAYPVLYMQDGQNLFHAERAFAGNPWWIDDAANKVIFDRQAQPMIIAGIDHAGIDRVHEYTPTHDEERKAGGGANAYADFLVMHVKSAVESRYRTNGIAATGGSSLGGLVSLYLALKHPDVFSSAAVMSPSVWWQNRSILQFVDTFQGDKPRLWVDIGGREGVEAIAGTRALRDHLKARGWNDRLHYEEDRRADHSERAWARRIPRVLEFLFPPV